MAESAPIEPSDLPRIVAPDKPLGVLWPVVCPGTAARPVAPTATSTHAFMIENSVAFCGQ